MGPIERFKHTVNFTLLAKECSSQWIFQMTNETVICSCYPEVNPTDKNKCFEGDLVYLIFP